MIYLDDKDRLTANLRINRFDDIRDLYIKVFGIIPSSYIKQYDIKTFTDFDSIDYEKLKQTDVPSRVTVSKMSKYDINLEKKYKNIESESSVYNEDDLEMLYGPVYTFFDRAFVASICIFEVFRRILVIDASSMTISILYDETRESDIVGVLNEYEALLPPPRQFAQGASVKMVLYDNGYYTTVANINSVELDIDENYNDDFKEIDKTVNEFLSNDIRKTGLLLFNGDPGTGKTMYIRHIISKYSSSKDFIIITPELASRLADPQMIAFLRRNVNSIFILEDCEEVTQKRGRNGVASAVSSLLNMSDGLMSDIFNAKFICTFNAPESEIDPAILRPGRCVAKYSFKKLSKEKTEALKKKMNITDDREEMTVAEIYNHNNLNKVDDESKTTKKIGF